MNQNPKLGSGTHGKVSQGVHSGLGLRTGLPSIGRLPLGFLEEVAYKRKQEIGGGAVSTENCALFHLGPHLAARPTSQSGEDTVSEGLVKSSHPRQTSSTLYLFI